MHRVKVLLLGAVLGLSILPASAKESDHVYVKIEGKVQGVFKGDTKRIVGDDFIPVIKFNYELTSPRDSATGQASGRRQHMAVVVTKAIDSASPQIFQALVNNENLKQVTIEFTTTTADGKEITYYKIILTDASVSDLHQHMNQAPTAGTSASDPSIQPMEDVSFSFRKIEETSTVGQTEAMDDWAVTK